MSDSALVIFVARAVAVILAISLLLAFMTGNS
jgi:hypothetical protein